MWVKGRRYETKRLEEKYKREPDRRLTSKQTFKATFIGLCIGGVLVYVMYAMILLFRWLGGLLLG